MAPPSLQCDLVTSPSGGRVFPDPLALGGPYDFLWTMEWGKSHDVLSPRLGHQRPAASVFVTWACSLQSQLSVRTAGDNHAGRKPMLDVWKGSLCVRLRSPTGIVGERLTRPSSHLLSAPQWMIPANGSGWAGGTAHLALPKLLSMGLGASKTLLF